MTRKHTAVLHSDPWLSSLSSHVRTAFVAAVRIKRYGAEAVIFNEGDGPTAYYGILSGEVRFSKITYDGKQSTLARLTAPRWFGELSFLDGGPRTHNAHTVGATSLAVVAKSDMQRLLADHTEIYAGFVQHLSRHTRLLYAAVDDLLLMSPERLLAKKLIEQLAISGSGAGADIDINQEELARLVGVSRQSINRTLRIWEGNGYIQRGYRKIRIEQEQAIRRLSE